MAGNTAFMYDDAVPQMRSGDLNTIDQSTSQMMYKVAALKGTITSPLSAGLMQAGKVGLEIGQRNIQLELEKKKLAAAEAVANAKQEKLWEREDEKWARDRTYKLEQIERTEALRRGEFEEKKYEKVSGEVSKSEKVKYERLIRTDPKYVQMIIDTARRKGVDPAEALSLLGQESSFSPDPLKRGDTDTAYGRAYSNWQVMKPLHPNFPTNQTELAQMQKKGKYEGMDLRTAQADYAIGYYGEVGPRGYYGTGKPPKGHPTTDTYERQHRNRAAWIGESLNQVIGEDGSYDVTKFTSGKKYEGAAPAAGEEPNAYQWYLGQKPNQQEKLDRDFAKLQTIIDPKDLEALRNSGATDYEIIQAMEQHGGPDGLRNAIAKRKAGAAKPAPAAPTAKPADVPPTAAAPEESGGLQPKRTVAEAPTPEFVTKPEPEPEKPVYTPPVAISPKDTPTQQLDKILAGLTSRMKNTVLNEVRRYKDAGFNDRQIPRMVQLFLEGKPTGMPEDTY